MITLKLSKLNFFTPKMVTNAVDRRKRRAQMKIGAFMRTSARRRMRRRKRAALPGQSPSVHQGFLKRFLLFGYDNMADSVVIGPAKILNKSFAGRVIPELMEDGGRVRRKGKTIDYAPHPTMGPTLDKEKRNDRLSQAWKDAVTR